MSLSKAKIFVLDRNGQPKKEPWFTALFNPEEYTVNKDNNFASQTIPGRSEPLLQFVNGNQTTMEMELFFDTYHTGEITKKDVRELTGKFLSLMDIDPDLHAPPILQFVWGDFSFTCVLARASQKFVMFANSGDPVRARITATFNRYVDLDREEREVKRQTSDYSRAHTVTEGESLTGLAAVYYKDPKRWRPIAIANGIDDPRFLAPGQALRIPPLPFIDPASGEAVN